MALKLCETGYSLVVACLPNMSEALDLSPYNIGKNIYRCNQYWYYEISKNKKDKVLPKRINPF